MLKIRYPTAGELLTSLVGRGFAIDGLVHEDEDKETLDSEVRPRPQCVYPSIYVYTHCVAHVYTLCYVYTHCPAEYTHNLSNVYTHQIE